MSDQNVLRRQREPPSINRAQCDSDHHSRPSLRQMSFQDIYHGLEAGLPPPPPPPALQTVVSHSVFQINTCVARLWRLADELAGCRGDARAVRERVRRTRSEATRLARNTARKLADAGGDVEPRLAVEFEASLRAFQRVQERIIAADWRQTTSYHDASPSRTGPYNGAGASGDHRKYYNIQMQQQQQLVESRRAQDLVHLEKEVTFNEALVQEWEQEIIEIFRELGKLIHGQHEAIEIVECNLGAAATETAQAEAELTEAGASQRRKTKSEESETDCMVIAAVVLVVLILVLLYFL
jgi:syntaxin 7